MPHMYNICHFLGEELLDSGLLGRGKIQEKLQEYIPLHGRPPPWIVVSWETNITMFGAAI